MKTTFMKTAYFHQNHIFSSKNHIFSSKPNIFIKAKYFHQNHIFSSKPHIFRKNTTLMINWTIYIFLPALPTKYFLEFIFLDGFTFIGVVQPKSPMKFFARRAFHRHGKCDQKFPNGNGAGLIRIKDFLNIFHHEIGLRTPGKHLKYKGKGKLSK